jgi:flotillin
MEVFMSLMTGVLIIVVLAVIVIIGFVFHKQYKKVAPNEVLVISGLKKHTIMEPDGHTRQIGYRFKVGGGAFINPFTEKAERLVLEVITINVKPLVATAEGVPIIAEATGQVRINTDDYPLHIAIEQFLGRGTEGIREVAESILEGKVRAVMGTMTVEEIYRNRLVFADKVQEAVAKDFAGLGLLMCSFALRDISDTQGYLEALSRPRIAAVKRDAAVAQAEADRDAAIQTSMARKESEIARLKAEAEIAGAAWSNEAKKADSQVEVNKRKAHADLSYELERQIIAQDLKKEEHLVHMIEKDNAIKLEELEVVRKEKELDATIIKPADAHKYQVQADAEAESFRLATEAKGKSEARMVESDAEAERIKKLGQADALAMLEKAKAYDKYNQAALYQMIIDVMPELAKSIAEPLSRIEKIVMIGTDGKLGTAKIAGQVSDVLAQVPEVIESITGIDVKKLIKDKLSSDKK